MHAHDQYLFVIRSIEDADVAALGQRFEVAPQVGVIEFFRRGRFETEDLRALRVHARHDVLDDAILARRVHRLQNDEQGIVVLGVQPVLLLGQLLDAVGQQFSGLLLFDQIARVAGIIVFLQADLFAGRYQQHIVQLINLGWHGELLEGWGCFCYSTTLVLDAPQHFEAEQRLQEAPGRQ